MSSPEIKNISLYQKPKSDYAHSHPVPTRGALAIVTNEGRQARSELDETTLKKIAEASEAKYFNAQTESDLNQIYDHLATELVLRDERTEITVVFAAAAAGLLLLAGCFSLLWFNRLP